MVLQRDVPIRLSGIGEPNRAATVSFDTMVASTRISTDGKWSVEFPAMEAGGPYEIKVSDGSRSASIHDVLIGDVWLCSGQSNMQMGLHETVGGETAAQESHPDIRILTMPRGGADAPKSGFDAKWQQVSLDALRDFSAVAYYFALALKKDPVLAGVPIGLINSTFGGTAIEAWMPELPKIPDGQVSGSMFGIPPASLYNGMIAPLTGLRLKGVTWYQGEANAGHPQVYATLLSSMIAQWRGGFKDPSLPFLIVQLPAFEGRMGDLDFGWLREAQAAACEKTSTAWFAVTYDTTDGRDLHPREKQEIGRRLALLAEREVYGKHVVAHGPKSVHVEVGSGEITIKFDQPLRARGDEVKGFAIAGNDGDFRFAEARIDGDTVSLLADGVSSPSLLRYAWGGLTDANLTNAEGLPAAPFRTDERKPESIAFQPLPAVYCIETPAYQIETGLGGRIASVVIHGKQFLSNEPDGGTTIPAVFGPRNLSHIRRVGPARLSLSDGSVDVEVAAGPDEMTWIIRNDDESDMEFRIALDAQVKAGMKDARAMLVRDDAQIEVTGIDRIDGSVLVTKVAPHTSREVTWFIPARE